MTKEEFKKVFEGFWDWTSSRDRCEVSWWSSVERYAGEQFNRAYDQQYNQKGKEGKHDGQGK